jgi:hypothetical protein
MSYILNTLEEITSEDIEQATNDIKDRHGLHSLEIYHSKKTGHLKLDSLIVPKDKQGSGVGSAAMHDIVALADKHNLPMSLHTGSHDPHHGTTSSNRLKTFYKRFGFVDNKGRNYNPVVSDNMIRPVQKK